MNNNNTNQQASATGKTPSGNPTYSHRPEYGVPRVPGILPPLSLFIAPYEVEPNLPTVTEEELSHIRPGYKFGDLPSFSKPVKGMHPWTRVCYLSNTEVTRLNALRRQWGEKEYRERPKKDQAAWDAANRGADAYVARFLEKMKKD